MKVPTPERGLEGWRVRSANDLLKEGWNRHLSRATMLAVVIHVLFILFWPSWTRDPSLADSPDPPEIEWITLLRAAGSLPGTLPVAAPISEISGPDEVDPDLEERVQGRESELEGLTETLRERLRGSSLLPMLAATETEPEPVLDEPEIPGEDSTTIRGNASTADLLTLPEAEALDLGRLSGVRPELALVLPSAWVLIRNPTEVERFIMGSYRRGTLDPDAAGSVSVTLWIDERGSVEWAEVSRSSGQTRMDEVALELFSEVVTFRPARDEGVPVSRSVVFSVQFPWF